MSNELMKTIEDHEDSLGELLESARTGDDAELKVSFLGFVAELVVDLPLVKPLVKLGAREIVSRSAPGQLRAALSRLRAEEGEEAQRKAIAGAVAELLRESLEGLQEGQEGLKRRLEALEKRNGAVRIRQAEVSEGVGTQVKNNATRDVDIEQGHVRGGIGVIIGD